MSGSVITHLITLGNGAAAVAVAFAPREWTTPVLVCGARQDQVETLRGLGIRASRVTAGDVARYVAKLATASASVTIGIAATLGGSSSSSALPPIGRAVRAADLPYRLAVTLPFNFEGPERMRQAKRAIAGAALGEIACLQLDSLFKLPRSVSLTDGFYAAHRWLFAHATQLQIAPDLEDYVQG